MRVLITGARGLVGRFFVADCRAAGDEVLTLGRRGADIEWRLGQGGALPAADLLIHCAFDHLPGAYRGGEGSDPEGFWTRNFDGTLRLLADARAAGVTRFVFLSSRAVYDGAPSLDEDAVLAPNSLYGRLKWETEQHLATFGPDIRALSLRATGVCGLPPGGSAHKWQDLFADYLAGRATPPRAATEVHGTDLAAAARLLLNADASGPFNVSDMVLDRRDLLAEVARLTRCPYPLPARDTAPVRAMPTTRLRALGWSPSLWPHLRADLPAMINTDHAASG